MDVIYLCTVCREESNNRCQVCSVHCCSPYCLEPHKNTCAATLLQAQSIANVEKIVNRLLSYKDINVVIRGIVYQLYIQGSIGVNCTITNNKGTQFSLVGSNNMMGRCFPNIKTRWYMNGRPYYMEFLMLETYGQTCYNIFAPIMTANADKYTIDLGRNTWSLTAHCGLDAARTILNYSV